jgi:threonine/homoserine/homoserine lactone efflux protein
VAVKFVGAFYLIFLGIRFLLAKKPVAEAAKREAKSDWRVFAQAIATGVLNPKVALFFLAFLPQFVRPERGAVVLQFLILGSILALFGFIGDSLVALTTGYFGDWLDRNPSFQQWRQRVTGMLLIGIGARLALVHRN